MKTDTATILSISPTPIFCYAFLLVMVSPLEIEENSCYKRHLFFLKEKRWVGRSIVLCHFQYRFALLIWINVGQGQAVPAAGAG